MQINRFAIAVPDEDLLELKKRIRQIRRPPPVAGGSWLQGMDPRFLREPVQYWSEEFDWRLIEKQLNRVRDTSCGASGEPDCRQRSALQSSRTKPGKKPTILQ